MSFKCLFVFLFVLVIEESAAGTICSAKDEAWTDSCATCIGKRKNWYTSNCIWCTNGDKRANKGGNCVGEAESCKDGNDKNNKFIKKGKAGGCPAPALPKLSGAEPAAQGMPLTQIAMDDDPCNRLKVGDSEGNWGNVRDGNTHDQTGVFMNIRAIEIRDIMQKDEGLPVNGDSNFRVSKCMECTHYSKSGTAFANKKQPELDKFKNTNFRQCRYECVEPESEGGTDEYDPTGWSCKCRILKTANMENYDVDKTMWTDQVRARRSKQLKGYNFVAHSDIGKEWGGYPDDTHCQKFGETRSKHFDVTTEVHEENPDYEGLSEAYFDRGEKLSVVSDSESDGPSMRRKKKRMRNEGREKKKNRKQVLTSDSDSDGDDGPGYD